LNGLLQGQVVAVFGRQYSVETPDGRILECVPRGKKSEVACGDQVEIQQNSENQGVIEKIIPRQTLLHRSVAHREKLIAANVTQIIVVVATEPSFSDELLARSLVAAHHQGIAPLIVLNKCDLPKEAASAMLQPYRDMGYPVLELSAKVDVTALRPLLQGHNSVLVGQSGMGKSTLINALLPEGRGDA
jgi:ribosome biogenesis GTPase